MGSYPVDYPLYEAASIMVSGITDQKERTRALNDALYVLEDASSPVTRKYQEKLFQAVIKKGHIDFGGIESSQGDITTYSGYGTMIQVLDTIDKLADEQKAGVVKDYTNVVRTAIKNLQMLSATFKRGFQAKCEFVMMEYNIFAYTCVEATTTLLNEFVDYIKRPDKSTMTITLKNTITRANTFYFEQLRKFNRVQETMGIDYRKMLESAINKGTSNFLGSDAAVGYAALSMVAMAIIPISREIVYQFFNLRKNASKTLEMQAKFLEMNRVAVENNESMDPAKKVSVLKKQEQLAKDLRRLSSVLKVEQVKAREKAKKELENDNKSMTLDQTRKDLEDSPITLF